MVELLDTSEVLVDYSHKVSIRLRKCVREVSMRYRVFQACGVLIVLLSHAFAQTQVIDELDEKIKRHLEKTLPGWKYERVEPFMNSPNVLVQFWSSTNRKVKISVMPYNSVQEAQEVFKNHRRYSLNKEPVDSVGDDAVASGYGSSDVAFRKDKYNVYISTTADVESDPDARGLTQAQIFEREKSEMRRLSREFAKHVANALTGP